MRQELRRFAHFLGVDVKDCLEKAGPISIGWVEGLGLRVWGLDLPNTHTNSVYPTHFFGGLRAIIIGIWEVQVVDGGDLAPPQLQFLRLHKVVQDFFIRGKYGYVGFS